MDSSAWDMFPAWEWNSRRRATFLGDCRYLQMSDDGGDVHFGIDEEPQVSGDDTLSEESRDDRLDYLLLAYREMAVTFKKEDELFVQLPKLHGDEALRMATATSEIDELTRWEGLVV
jgi:hypothetical protein